MNYDSIIITLILIADSASLFLLWRSEQRKAIVKNSRKFNKILRSVGLR